MFALLRGLFGRGMPPAPVPSEPPPLAALSALFRRTEDIAPQIGSGFAPAGLQQPDPAELTLTFRVTAEIIYSRDAPSDTIERRERPAGSRQLAGPAAVQRIGDDLYGITFGIEYVDAGGASSTRRITLHELYRHDTEGTVYLQCFCHERKASRTFRFDRIETIYDLDGVAYDPESFFRDELRVDLAGPSPAPVQAAPPKPLTKWGAYARELDQRLADEQQRQMAKPGGSQRLFAGDGARVLAALARSDGMMHPAEVEVIVDYMAERCARDGLPTSDEDRRALAAHVKRLRPGPNAVAQMLKWSFGSGADQELLLRSAIALANADGLQDEAEIAMLVDLRERLSAPSRA
jgi:hypothetical protein